MSDLIVYDSRGNVRYPESVKSDPTMADYFDKHIFQIYTEQGHVVIEAYLEVRTERRKEQISLRYRTTDFDDPFAACHEAIDQQLVKQLGWSVRRPNSSDASYVSWSLIYNSEQTEDWSTSSPAGASSTMIDLNTSDEEDVILNKPSYTQDITVRIQGASYQYIVRAIPQAWNTDRNIAVSRKQREPPERAAMHFTMMPSQSRAFKLHEQTRSVVQKKYSEYVATQREEKLRELGDTVEELNILDTPDQEILQHLNSVFNTAYQDLQVMRSTSPEKNNLAGNPTPVITDSSSVRRADRDAMSTRRKRFVVIILTIFIFLLSLVSVVLIGIPTV